VRSDRNNAVVQKPAGGRGAAHRVDDDRLLDAVRACVLAVGVRRTTLTDVARRAEVSRMTLYRRFPDVNSLVTALMAREFGGLLDLAAAEGAKAISARQQLVTAALSAIRLLAENPVMGTLLDRDPELLLPYLMQRIGRAQAIAERHITEFIVAGHAEGSIRGGEAAVQARVLLFITQTFVFSLRPASSDVDQTALLDELASQLDAALAPREARVAW
jgi:AcrR family transcriptional regulator